MYNNLALLPLCPLSLIYLSIYLSIYRAHIPQQLPWLQAQGVLHCGSAKATSLVDPVHELHMEEGDGVDIPDPLTIQIRCSSLAHIKRLWFDYLIWFQNWFRV